MKYHTATMHTPDSLRTKIPKCTHFYMEYQRFLDVHQGRVQDLVKGGARVLLAEFCRLRTVESCERSEPLLAELLVFSLPNMHSLHFGVPFYTIFEIIKY